MARIKGKKEESLSSDLDLINSDLDLNDDESSTASFTKKRGTAPSEPKQSVKVELPESLSKFIHEGILTLEERGLKRTASDFIQSCLEGVAEAQVSNWVEKETPLQWRVTECLKDEEKAKLIKKLFDLDSSKSPQVIKAIEQVFEKKEKGNKAGPKKKKKPSVPAPHPESNLVRSEPKLESSLLS